MYYEKRTRYVVRALKPYNMSKNRNRAKLNKAKDGREYRRILMDELYPLYWDEGIYLYPRYRMGFKNSGRQIYPWQVRQYRTWKYNRKTQYKPER